jgi:hypothetical protein
VTIVFGEEKCVDALYGSVFLSPRLSPDICGAANRLGTFPEPRQAEAMILSDLHRTTSKSRSANIGNDPHKSIAFRLILQA